MGSAGQRLPDQEKFAGRSVAAAAGKSGAKGPVSAIGVIVV